MSELIRVYDEIGARDVPASPGEFLDRLPGPSLFRRRGRDRARLRVVVGLLHGNEPSGLFAIHQALRQSQPFAVDTVFFLGAVEAARAEPRHGHRMLPGRRDLNRCFGLPPVDVETRVADAARRLLSERQPEAVLDLHNNTGQNPAYAVGFRADQARLGLTRLFARHFIRTDYRMGTLMEVFDPLCPTVTIEAGRAGDPAADTLAARGLLAFLGLSDLEALPTEPEIEVLDGAIRVQLAPDVDVAFARESGDAALVMDPDFDRHNFQALAARTRIGRLMREDVWPLVALDAGGQDRARELFQLQGGELVTRLPMTPVMITTQPAIARVDCLFYALSPGKDRS